jgi:hypothetical protein
MPGTSSAGTIFRATKAPQVQQLIKKAGPRLLYLPPYTFGAEDCRNYFDAAGYERDLWVPVQSAGKML